MTRDETVLVLKRRFALTGESFNADTVAVWHDALARWARIDVERAVKAASFDTKRVTVADVAPHLPLPPRPPEPPPPPQRGRIPTFAEGVQIAARANADECHARGREPDWTLWKRATDAITGGQS